MSSTPLFDRIGKPAEPQPISEKMSPFMRRLAEKRLPVSDRTGEIQHDGCGPNGRAA